MLFGITILSGQPRVVISQISPESSQEYIQIILNTPGLSVSDADMITQALSWYVEKNVDFIDAYNAAWVDEAGLSRIFTFDQKHFRRFSRLTALLPSG